MQSSPIGPFGSNTCRRISIRLLCRCQQMWLPVCTAQTLKSRRVVECISVKQHSWDLTRVHHNFKMLNKFPICRGNRTIIDTFSQLGTANTSQLWCPKPDSIVTTLKYIKQKGISHPDATTTMLQSSESRIGTSCLLDTDEVPENRLEHSLLMNHQ